MKLYLLIIMTALFIVGCATVDTPPTLPAEAPLEEDTTEPAPTPEEERPEPLEQAVEEEPTQQETAEDVPAQETFLGITREQIAEHNTRQSCWVAYQGQVYDLTAWIRQHPGGAGAIAPYCGTVEEFEQAYDRRHGARDDGLLRTEPMGPFAG